MKLETLHIEDFRGIQRMELNFADDLDRVAGIVPVVGPNTSGKTSILDAITLCLGPATELWTMRPDLVYSPASIVRRGAARAKVTCTVRFSNDEIAATRALFERAEDPDAAKVPDANRVTVRWEYPDPKGVHKRGFTRYDPVDSYLLFKGRVTAARNLHVPGVSARDLERVGGVFLLDQKRTGLGQRAKSKARGASNGGGVAGLDSTHTNDPREILLGLAIRAQAPQHPLATERLDFERFRDLFELICKPHRLKGLLNTETGLDLEFEGPQGAYLFDGLSSGQLMLLLLLLQFSKHRVHRSIVLIDELELHLHPLWQTRLYEGLDKLGQDNQVLFTTHSTHLRDLLHGTFFHCTGELGDAVEKKEI